MRPPRFFIGLWLPALLAGCSDATVPVGGFVHPTLVEVSPAEFLGTVPCLDAPGAMRRYVATVIDVSVPDEEGDAGAGGEGPATAELPLPSSGAVPCQQRVAFSRVVAGHRYRAEIQGYDRDDLVAPFAGVPILVDPASGERIEPRWRARCGDRQPVTSLTAVTRTVRDCDPLSDAEPSGEATLLVGVDEALGDLECGDEPGAVARFEVSAPDGVHEAACSELVTLVGLGLGIVTLPLRAFEAAEGEPSFGATCVGEVRRGVTTRATCPRLTDRGAVEIHPRDAADALGLSCDAGTMDFAELELVIEGEEGDPVRVLPSECARAVRFSDLPRGPAIARASARLPDGSRSPDVTCPATVIPGGVSRAACTLAQVSR